MSGQVSSKPEETWALVVGVESYPLRPGLELNGPFPDACEFARWLRSRGVLASHITLLASPLDGNKDQCLELQGEGVQCLIDKPVTEETVENALKQFRNKPGMLVVFWSGHGIRTADGVRRALLGNYSDADKHSLNLESLQIHLRSDTYAYPAEQALIFDICGTRFDELSHSQALPDRTEPYYPEAPGCRQFFLFASEDGQVAENVTQERTGLFYRELRVILEAQAGWPPDLEKVHELVKSRFKELRDSGTAGQVPIRYRYESPSGEREEVDLVSNPRAGVRYIAALFMLGVAIAMLGALLVFPSHRADASVNEIKGRLVTLGKDDQDRSPLKGMNITVLNTGDKDTTNDNGLFTIKLSRELRAGQTVELDHDKKDYYVIIHPDFYGRVRVPAAGEIVEVWAVEKRSKFILADQRLERFIERVADEAAMRAKQPGMPPAVDWGAEVARLARESGYREEEVLGRIREWAKKVKEDGTDYRKMGQAALVEKNFGLARENFREAALRNKREAARNLVSAGEVAYAGGKYEQAVGDYSEAARLLDPVRDGQMLREVRFKRANGQVAFGESGDPEKAVRSFREAIGTYREFLSTLNEKTEKQNWAMTQNNLGNALAALGMRSGGAEGIKHLQGLSMGASKPATYGRFKTSQCSDALFACSSRCGSMMSG